MLSKKKILVFIDWYLPGYRAGGPIQSCANLIAHLWDEFDFFIVTRDTDYCETQAYQGIRSNEWNTLKNGSKVFYISQASLSASLIKKICHETDFDYVYINGVYSFYFSILPLYYLRKIKSKKIIVASRGMLAQSAIKVKKTKKSFFLFVSKICGLFTNVTFQATTLDEVTDIKNALGKKTKIILAGNLPKKFNSGKYPVKEKIAGKLKLISIARIAPEKNLKFALQILKEVKAEIIFDFYGPVYNETYFNECLKLVKELPANILANYKYSIESSEVSGTFENYHALFMPTFGENFGHIILESLVAGCPVIISDQTPWKNLASKKSGFDISIAEKNKFVKSIVQLANYNQNEFTTWSRAAFDFGNEYVNNPEILKQNLNLFKD